MKTLIKIFLIFFSFSINAQCPPVKYQEIIDYLKEDNRNYYEVHVNHFNRASNNGTHYFTSFGFQNVYLNSFNQNNCKLYLGEITELFSDRDLCRGKTEELEWVLDFKNEKIEVTHSSWGRKISKTFRKTYNVFYAESTTGNIKIVQLIPRFNSLQ